MLTNDEERGAFLILKSLTTCAGKTCHARRNAFVTESPTTWYVRRHAIVTEKKTTCVARRVGLFARAQIIIALHSVQLSIFNSYSKMESKSEVNDIISTNRKRKHDSDKDSDFDEVVFPLRNRRIILSDDEEECINEDCEINLISNEWI
ncbi:hypothetical protein AVEN_250928-1 [Araneus ventricosus]|uniref:Uncharacterized protein n=1 Tax=Araneus ventricosus TaxID=182803 RepID=A0A4Y2TH89_ARAVE|nr:hypothetical protein AVEN_250928-1 [Araneus ventricosus]